MSKKKIRLLICIILVIISVLYTAFCLLNSDSRLFLAIISVLGTGAILIKELYTK
jgi:hypothetical protein